MSALFELGSRMLLEPVWQSLELPALQLDALAGGHHVGDRPPHLRLKLELPRIREVEGLSGVLDPVQLVPGPRPEQQQEAAPEVHTGSAPFGAGSLDARALGVSGAAATGAAPFGSTRRRRASCSPTTPWLSAWARASEIP